MKTSPNPVFDHKTLEADVCVVGGGMAGLCAAVASARNGAKTLLVQDRPVLGGNASSEVRMWICGAYGKTNKETGLLEEIQLDNLHYNRGLNYSVWDSVLWAKAAHQPNLTLLLNTSVCDGHAEGRGSGGGRLQSLTAWQLTSQTWFTLHAKHFIDCSGDSILAPLSGAETRWGRESRNEFNEDIAPDVADGKTMGNTLLIQLRRTDKPQKFTPPSWAMRFDGPEDLPHRINGVKSHNFWWIEVGGTQDTIRDAESIRDELYRVAYGVWDYIKNRAPEKDEAEGWAIEFIGSLPGKRENRRYVGDHILTQHDVRVGAGYFDDVIAHGGWSMDDHHPAGMYYPGRPTLFHEAPSPYDIPYRCLYSHNVSNLLCAGRNISTTHTALSSTRVMATCSVIGQAAGTAAALCVRHGVDPASLSSGDRLKELQTVLMDQDVWLPGRPRGIDPLAQSAKVEAEETTERGHVSKLLDGTDRDLPDTTHTYEGPIGKPITFTWDSPVNVPGLRLSLDSNLASEKRMPYTYPQASDRDRVPGTMIKDFRVEARDASGQWQAVKKVTGNFQRLLHLPLDVQTDALRVVPEATWGADVARMMGCEPMATFTNQRPAPDPGITFKQRQAQLDPADLAAPDSGLEDGPKKSARFHDQGA
ncbi:MAG: FAD-dependent oxidoreductase [Planctomycetota bacterium]